MLPEQDNPYSDRIYGGNQYYRGRDVFDQLYQGVIFAFGHVDNKLDRGIEHFSHEHQGDRDAKGDQRDALKFKINTGQKSGDPAEKDNPHVAMENKKIPQAFERDYQAFSEAVKPENTSKKSFSSHGYLKIMNSISTISKNDKM
jgi:hypothetical protein